MNTLKPISVNCFGPDDLVFSEHDVTHRDAMWQAKVDALQDEVRILEGYRARSLELATAYNNATENLEQISTHREHLLRVNDALQARCDAVDAVDQTTGNERHTNMTIPTLPEMTCLTSEFDERNVWGYTTEQLTHRDAMWQARFIALQDTNRANTITCKRVIQVLIAERDALQARCDAICTWTLDDDESGTWASSCGELWSFIDGGPAENRVNYCHYCGGKCAIAAMKGTPT